LPTGCPVDQSSQTHGLRATSSRVILLARQENTRDVSRSRMDYIAFADESGIGEQLTSIASFSFRSESLPAINDQLWGLLAGSDIREFKWQKLKNAKYRFCAVKLLDVVWSLLGRADARIDVLVWDNQDTRHAIFGRDDTANFGRMFFHLQSHALKKRPSNSIWKIYPDEKIEIDWGTISKCLSAVGRRKKLFESPLFGDFFKDPYYSIEDFRQVQSDGQPCCQIADLFAGLALFSRTHYDSFERWTTRTTNLGLWEEETLLLSNREENRFHVLQHFDSGCKSRHLGVSLKTRRCLHTPFPNNPINFWRYEPQHDQDRAPTRRGQQ
jgi:hypothetical protein